MTPVGADSRTEAEVDPAKTALAKGLAEDLVDCNPSIMSLIVVDALGRVLYVSRSQRLPKSEHVDPELVRVFGTIAKTIVGAAANAAPVMGEMDAIVGIFKKQKVLLFNMQKHDMVVALRLSRSAYAEYVLDNIRDALATRGER
jgi:hypothetical protein